MRTATARAYRSNFTGRFMPFPVMRQTAPRRTTRFLSGLPCCFPSVPLVSRRMNTSPFTESCLPASIIRDYNITKKEWVLNGATIFYGSATELRATLDYDFS